MVLIVLEVQPCLNKPTFSSLSCRTPKSRDTDVVHEAHGKTACSHRDEASLECTYPTSARDILLFLFELRVFFLRLSLFSVLLSLLISAPLSI